LAASPEVDGRDRPAFLVTVDTEGDNEWARPNPIPTRNAAFLPRFQALCEEFGLKPTWLTNFEMASSPGFVRFGRDVVARGAGEIGMHLHAWSSPPIRPLTHDDHATHPYLIEFAPEVMEQKIGFMTDLLQQQFGVTMVSHRGGRWAFNATYARMLVEHGYLVDCSVTPHFSWHDMPGDPAGSGGTDYRKFPEQPYWVNLNAIDQPGESQLLEVPLTIVRSRLASVASWTYRVWGLRRYARHFGGPPLTWMYPDGGNGARMVAALRRAVGERRAHVEFVIHSSELMPGGGPAFPDEASIESLYTDLRQLFKEAARTCRGMTLKEFRQTWVSQQPAPSGRRAP
jgi:hypothetical protein